jgi:hypothetical protein
MEILFDIGWRGAGWYGQRMQGNTCILRFLDNEREGSWTEQRGCWISDLAQERGYSSAPRWFDRLPTHNEMLAGRNDPTEQRGG